MKDNDSNQPAKKPEAEAKSADKLPLLQRWLSRRWLRWLLITLASLVTLFALFHAVENFRGKRAWSKYRAELDAKGVVPDLKKLAPPPVPDDENFAMVPGFEVLQGYTPENPTGEEYNEFNRRLNVIRFDGSVHAPEARQRRLGQRVDLAAWQTYFRESESVPSPESPGKPAEDVLLGLNYFDDTLAVLEEAAKRPKSRFDLDYDAESPFAILLSHLGPLRDFTDILKLRAVAHLRLGQQEEAYRNLQLILRLEEAIADEPFLISLLVRSYIIGRSLDVLWEGLHAEAWSDEQLAGLQVRLGTINLIAALQRSMEAEQAAGDHEAHRICQAPETFVWLLGESSSFLEDLVQGTEPKGKVLRLVPRGWMYQERRNLNYAYQTFVLPGIDGTNRRVEPQVLNANEAALKNWIHEGPNAIFTHRILAGLMIPALVRASEKGAFGQVEIDFGRLAIALKRYQRAHAELPASLEELVPGLMAALPADPLTGKPYRYEPLPEGEFRLISLGWNLADDGGTWDLTKSGGPSMGEGDWLWESKVGE